MFVQRVSSYTKLGFTLASNDGTRKKITKPDQTREKWIERKEWVLCVRLMTLLVMCTIQKHKNGGTHTQMMMQ